MSTAAIFAGLCLLLLLLQAFAFFLFLRFIKNKATFKRILAVTFLLCLVSLVPSLTRMLLFGNTAPEAKAGLIALYLVTLAAEVALLRGLFRLTLGKALLAWLFSLIPSVLGLLFALLVVRPFLVEAFVVPTNGMAPTIEGTHIVAVCPHCGGELIADAPRYRLHPGQEIEVSGICTRCWKTSSVRIISLSSPITGDRILVAKYVTPRRWDIIAYKDPTSGDIYIKRLVGLPGERISFSEGHLVIDGKPLPPPPDLPNLTYTPPANPFFLFGRPESPDLITAGRYFVVGDNSQFSNDSRHTGPIPTENCLGVVTWTYAPLPRIHLFR